MTDQQGIRVVQADVPDWAYTIARTLLQALKERDPYTYGHCRRVARNSKLLADAARLPQEEQIIVEFASMFHDLGKMGIPDRILLKPARLDAEEEAIMRSHPLKSLEIIGPLSHIPLFRATIPAVRSHHERMDGLGYPDGLKGDEIPIAARVILIADTFDALTTTRPYRKGISPEDAYTELFQHAGSQFDARLIDVFTKSHPGWSAMEEEITEEFVSVKFRRAA